MTQNKINLLQRDLVVATKFRHLTKISLLVMSFYLVAIVGVFSFYFFLNLQRGGLGNKNSELTGRVSSLKDTEGLLVTLKNRVAQAKSLYSTAKPTPAELIEAQVKLLPEGAEVTSINAKDDGTVALLVKTQNSQDANLFLRALEEQQPTTLILNSLILASDGYQVSIEVSE